MTAGRAASYDAGAVPAPFATKYIDAGGLVLHCLHSGPTTLPGVVPPFDRGALFVLVHGSGRNAADWKRQLVGLADRHSVVALDLPGHGRAPGIDGCPTIEAYADVVDRFVATVARRKCVLVGWSMGSLIALVSTTRHPERYAGVALMGCTPCWRPEPGALEPYRDVVRGRAGQRFDTMQFSPATQMDVMREFWMEQVKTDPRVLYTDMLACAAFDGMSLLAKVALPALVLHGADDRFMTADIAQSVAAGIPGATLETIADAGHAAQLEQPERMNALLSAFAERTA